MNIKKFNIYLTDLGKAFGTEPGKVKPVVVVQTDILNNVHPSTIVCPLTTKIRKDVSILRVNVSTKEAGLSASSDILVDQILAIDNRRLKRHLGRLNDYQTQHLISNLQVLLFE